MAVQTLIEAERPLAILPVPATFAAEVIDRRSFLLVSCLCVVVLANAVTGRRRSVGDAAGAGPVQDAGLVSSGLRLPS
ncbi:MAG: hypothetical protein F4X97_04910 [Boseongicola sp. SB0662_bin_57]|nr:hypothetical protein [Boseongicola sp. SB0662_bin_57]